MVITYKSTLRLLPLWSSANYFGFIDKERIPMKWLKGKNSSGFAQTTQPNPLLGPLFDATGTWGVKKKSLHDSSFFATVNQHYFAQSSGNNRKMQTLQVSGLIHVKGMFLLFFAISCLILKRPILPLFQLPWPPAPLIAAAPPWLLAPVLKGAQVRNVFKAIKLASWCPQAVRNHVNLEYFYHW